MNAIQRTLCIVSLAAGAALAACTGPANTVYLAGPTPSAPPTPPMVGAVAPFAVQVIASAAPSVPLPVAGGYTGTFSQTGTIQQFAQVDEMLQNGAPSSLPPLSVRRKLQVAPAQVLFYYGLTYDAQIAQSSVTLAVTLPPAAQIPGAVYFLAFYDPERPSLGWQQGFAGPAASAPSLTFTGGPVTFNRYYQYWFALYAAASTAPSPTPAPSVSPLVTPTPSPGTLTNIQNLLSLKTSCTGTPCASGPIPPPRTPQPPIPYAIATAVPTPSLSGSSTKLTIFPYDQHGDVLWYTDPLVSAPLATNFVWDFWFTIDSPLADAAGTPVGEIEALEFDFNIGMPGYTYNFSSQCVYSKGAWVWQIWGYNGNGQGWIDSGFACTPQNFSPDPAHPWHHIVWTYAIDPATLGKRYISLVLDGVTYTPSPTAGTSSAQPRPGETKTFLEVQFQQDARPVPTANPLATPSPSPVFNEWVDNVTLTWR